MRGRCRRSGPVVDDRPTLRVLGIRGIPAAHGGFETFAERLSLYLVARGWRVVVYCQQEGRGPVSTDTWRGVERIHVPVALDGAKGTVWFDWLATRHAARHGDLCLTLGYNTAVFCTMLRLLGVPNLINMDGLEWARAKWGFAARTWFRWNERIGCWIGNHLIADHPEIARHLQRRVPAAKVTMIAYGADAVVHAPVDALHTLGLRSGGYLTLIARPEPENSVLQIVQAFSMRPRGVRLAVLGQYNPQIKYHAEVLAAAGPEVSFLGAIYDKPLLRALRLHSIGYLHGHRVGGTNPSLVEALGAGNPIIAHDNRFNRWVAGAAGRFFVGVSDLDKLLAIFVNDRATQQAMSAASRARFEADFTWPRVLESYEHLLQRYLPQESLAPAALALQAPNAEEPR